MVRVKRRAVSAVLAAGMSAALVAIAGPASAATSSIDITTTKAMATGQFTRVSEQGGQPLVWRPHLTISASVVCPAGSQSTVEWSFGNAAMPAGTSLTCTGQSQQVSVTTLAGTSGPGNPRDVTVTATLYDTLHVALASDSQVVNVVTKGYRLLALASDLLK